MPVLHVDTEANFKKLLEEADDKLVVVDFYATWCGPCKKIGPEITSMSNNFVDVMFLKIDVDENDEIAERYKISAMPTFVFIKKNETKEIFSGANSTKILELINKYK